jgi:tetratricopeptide (TPR) repeat protein
MALRFFLIAALFALTACQTLNGASSPQTTSASGSRAGGLIQLVSCLRASDPDQKISQCSGLIKSAGQIEPDPAARDRLLSSAHVLRASGYLDKRDFESARRDLDRAEKFNPENAGVYLARSIIWQRENNHTNMMRDLDRAVALDPDLAVVYPARANARIATIFPDARRSGPLETEAERAAVADARADITKFRTLDPKYGAPWRLYGDIYFELAEYDSAIGNYSEAIKRNASDAEAFEHRGSAYFRISDTGSAIRDFETAIRLAPANPNSYVKLGWLLAAAPEARFRDGNRAIEMAQEAERLADPQRPAFLILLLPVAYAEAGRFDEAVRAQERVVEEIKSSAITSDEDTESLLGLYISAEGLLEEFRNGRPFRLPDNSPEI